MLADPCSSPRDALEALRSAAEKRPSRGVQEPVTTTTTASTGQEPREELEEKGEGKEKEKQSGAVDGSRKGELLREQAGQCASAEGESRPSPTAAAAAGDEEGGRHDYAPRGEPREGEAVLKKTATEDDIAARGRGGGGGAGRGEAMTVRSNRDTSTPELPTALPPPPLPPAGGLDPSNPYATIRCPARMCVPRGAPARASMFLGTSEKHRHSTTVDPALSIDSTCCLVSAAFAFVSVSHASMPRRSNLLYRVKCFDGLEPSGRFSDRNRLAGYLLRTFDASKR